MWLYARQEAAFKLKITQESNVLIHREFQRRVHSVETRF